MKLDSKVPSGPLADKWRKYQFDLKLISPANKRKYDIIVVGTGLAGASTAATLAELGYNCMMPIESLPVCLTWNMALSARASNPARVSLSSGNAAIPKLARSETLCPFLIR